MFDIIFLILLGFSVAGILFIIIKKFPQLANLDIDNLPEEKESRKKKEMMKRRVSSESNKLLGSILKKANPITKFWGRLQLQFRIYVGRIERLFHHEQRSKIIAELSSVPKGEVENKISSLVQEGDYYLSQGELDKAEERFISAIKLDAKYAPAYRGLGDTYLAKNSLEEAKETYGFFLQLQPNDDMAMVKISELYEKEGKIEEAINYLQQAVILNDSLSPRFYHLAELLIKVSQPDVAREAIIQAVELEPKNPKFLDLLIETGILCGDKDLAGRGFEELRLVNPENQKLEGFQSRINALN